MDYDLCAAACRALIDSQRLEKAVTAAWLGLTTIILTLAFVILLYRFIKHFPGTLMSRASLGLVFSYATITMLRYLLTVQGKMSLEFPLNILYILLNIGLALYFLWALLATWVVPWLGVWRWRIAIRWARRQKQRGQR